MARFSSMISREEYSFTISHPFARQYTSTVSPEKKERNKTHKAHIPCYRLLPPLKKKDMNKIHELLLAVAIPDKKKEIRYIPTTGFFT